MGVAMKVRSSRHHARRSGISLLEVIACTALLAVMLVPIAGVIRASGQSIQQAQNGRPATELRTTLKWLRETIGDSRIVTVARNSLQLQLSDGRSARVFVQSSELILDDGTDQILLADNIRDVRFQSVRSPVPPRNRVGLEIRLRATDQATGGLVSVDCIVAETPQL